NGERSYKEVLDELNRAVELSSRDNKGVLGFFRDLLDFIVTFITGRYALKSYEVDKLFESIQAGKFKMAKIQKDNLTNIDNILVTRLKIKGEVLDYINSPKQLRNIVKGLVNILINKNDIEN